MEVTANPVGKASIRNYLARHPQISVICAMLLSSLVVYIPILFRDFTIAYRHYDGPFYMYIAKTFYVIPPDHPFHSALPPEYYAAHFPIYPLLIRALTLLTFGNYPVAMLLATLLSSVVAACLFYRLLKEWNLVRSPLWIAVLFCFIPERWLLQHSIGATEPLFFCFVFGAFLAFKRNKDWVVFVCLFFAAITRPPGFLLTGIFTILYLRRKRWRAMLLMPLALSGLVLLFLYHHYVYGDFLAAFKAHTTMAFASTTRRHSSLDPAPLAIYRFYAERPNFHSTELYLLLYGINLIGTLALWKRRELFIYSAVFFVFTLFVFNYELPRYFLPIAPFSILVAFEQFFSRRVFRFLVFPFYLYLAYTFVWGFLPLAVCSPEAFQMMLEQLHR